MKRGVLLTPLLLALTLAGCENAHEAHAWIATPAPLAELVTPRNDLPETEAKADNPEAPLRLTLPEVLLRALENNPSFRLERFSLQDALHGVQDARAAFDPQPTVGWNGTRARQDTQPDAGAADTRTDTDTEVRSLTVSEFLPTGTTLSASATDTRVHAGGDPANRRDRTVATEVRLTQSLLRGFGPRVNLAELRLAKIGVETTRHALQAAAETLVENVESTYWDYLLSQRQIAILEASLALDRRRRDEIAERIRLGRLAESEMPAAEATLLAQEQTLIAQKNARHKARLGFFRFLTPAGREPWAQAIVLVDEPVIGLVELAPVQAHVDHGLVHRPDLNQARLGVERGDLQIVQTRNGLLPQLDFFVALGGTRFAQSFYAPPRDTKNTDRDFSAGFTFEYTFDVRRDRTAWKRVQLTAERAREALANQAQTVQIDIRSAYVDVESAAKQVTATAASRAAREKVWEIEQEKFRLGRTTSFLLSQARRDLLQSRLDEVASRIAYRKALTRMHRLDGSLLGRRGIRLPTSNRHLARPAPLPGR